MSARVPCGATHPIPDNWAFEKNGEVFEGGRCPECQALVKGRFLGSVSTQHEEFLHEVPDYAEVLNTEEGDLIRRELMEVFEQAQTPDEKYRAWKAYDEQMTKLAERFPKVHQRMRVAEGRTIMHFEKEGYKVTRLSS